MYKSRIGDLNDDSSQTSSATESNTKSHESVKVEISLKKN
jgi:hypothetical protein